ncbi:exonuclease subunit SbcC [Synechocystis sp. LKSZ1]|uniref:exonuclease subunit SbcC n=1 Tax=Synechocystis sp. LKSZ1 TaxID=3144951 RepID=UPI00336BCBC1
MIPQSLSLTNFLSYHQAHLDFRGLHTACICGANGAGKSSLLEAITWVIWGQSRAASEDDVLHSGTDFVRVDFVFISNHQTYKIIRSRHRGKGTGLDFQIADGSGFRPLSGKGVKATQVIIINTLKLDYDTFINSAYLRQGRADEFMLRRPAERKQILADLLKLDQYEVLAERAKDIAKQEKAKADLLDQALQSLQQKLDQREEIQALQQSLLQEIEALQQTQAQEEWQLQQLQVSQNQRRSWQQQWEWQENQSKILAQDLHRFQQEQTSLTEQCHQLQQLVAQRTEIEANYQAFLALQQQEETLAAQFQADQAARQTYQALQQQLQHQENELQRQLAQQQLRLDHLHQQEQELLPILSQEAEIRQGLERLEAAKQALQALDQLQHRVAPLLQRRYTLQAELERIVAQHQAKLEQRQLLALELQRQMERIPQQRRNFQALDQQIQDLKKRQNYQKRVGEKGQERRHFQERLQEHQRLCEKQLLELGQKLTLLDVPDALCPLCEQHLDGHYHQQVLQKTQHQQQELQEQIWILKAQIAVCERELQVLRGEYGEIQKELQPLDKLQQQYGQLEAELERSGESHDQLQQLRQEIQQLETALHQQTLAPDLQAELVALDQELQALNYDEQTHALARAEVERWRKSEIRRAHLQEAQRKQQSYQQERPGLLAQCQALQQSLTQLPQSSEFSQALRQAEQQIQDLGYDRSQHQQVLQQLRHQQPSQLQYQSLQQAQEQLPQVQERLAQAEQRLAEYRSQQMQIQGELERIQAQINHYADHEGQIQALEKSIQQRRQSLDQHLARKGGYDQQLQQLETLQVDYQEAQRQLQQAKKQEGIYKELAQAFGKNGIQALMIENILPQLEAETNHILARLTGNQFHLQFVTQKASKSGSKRKGPKMIDTLDILIADPQGTRAYETYSGGEAFRINFSIRLALARLLAQRAGTALQLLIIDEGFGTQDSEGCSRLVAAINAIAADFACILAVTHMPQFKESFQQRIEVHKSNQGSSLQVIS